MLQVVQYQKNGEVKVEEFPAPGCIDGGILVQVSYSLISAGTEKISVENAKGSLLQRAKRQPDQVKLVVDNIRKEGIATTVKRVKSKLDSYKLLGYSASGVVIESDCDEFQPGDYVACAGSGYANHAEIITVPKNLAAKVPEGAGLKDAAYTTVGAIAMQGVRQSDNRLGETVAVIGLGLIGQLTIQILKAAGCNVIGMDINKSLFKLATELGCDSVYHSSAEYIDNIIAATGGLGCDSVIITASTDSSQPLELAMKIVRKKGKVVVVGSVGMQLPRSPFYEKEADLRISCSYGPGRYDTDYEVKGRDYPPAYVRWTEQRNMQAFLGLIRSGKLKTDIITSHVFDIGKSPKAYDIITGKVPEPFNGILIKYPERKEALRRTIKSESALESVLESSSKSDKIKVAFIGAGQFAQNYLIPPLKKEGVEFVSVSTSKPSNAKNAADKFGFVISSTDSSALIEADDSNLIFCATRHDTHARYVLESLKNNKSVFVEKPLAISPGQLEEISEALGGSRQGVMVGFNRRFSQSFKLIDGFCANRSAPMAINYRVNAGRIPKSHWVQAEGQGGRIIGEACHFIDCMVFLTGSLPVRVFAESVSSESINFVNSDNVIITIKFSDGSIGVVSYIADGDSSLPKEYCEVFCERSVAIMNNFNSVELIKNGNRKIHKFDGKKGINEEIHEVVKAVRNGGPMPIPFDRIYAVTRATFAAVESLKSGMPVQV